MPKSLPLCAAAFVLTLWIGGLGPSVYAQTNVGQYEKFEVSFPFTGSYSNVYDPSVVDVEATFTAPDGSPQTIPGFFFQDFTRSGSVSGETLTLVPGSDSWKVRYAPSQLGTYSYTVTLKDTGSCRTPCTLGSGTFTSVVSSNPGFIKVVGMHLEFSNGQQFIPLGINSPWFQFGTDSFGLSGTGQWGDGTYGYDVMQSEFLANGANFFHQWTCAWSSGNSTPFAKPDIACDSSSTTTTTMSQPDSWEMDYIVNQSHANNIYVMPILKHRDQQNIDPGDPLYMRYAVSRWGYSTSIVAWDTFKEGATNTATVHSYITTLHGYDPYNHPVTASQWNHYPTLNSGDLNIYNTVFGDSAMNIVQNHDYGTDCNDDLDNDTSLYLFNIKEAPGDPRNWSAFGKPSFFGETGVHPGSGNPCTQSSSGKSPFWGSQQGEIIPKGEVWGALMSTLGGISPWHYERDPGGAWTHLSAFAGPAAYVAALPPVPDSATLFTSYNDTSQVTTSDSRLRVIGRKDATFAMFYVQNTTGTWAAILRDGQTPVSLTGVVTILNMTPGSYSVKWFDTDSGAVLATNNVTGTTSGLPLALPTSITQSVAAFVVPAAVPPPPPTNLVATAGNAQVSLSWSASAGATSYNVKHATTSGGPYTTVGSPTTTNFTDTGLTNGTSYFYVVTAVNSNGESANSNQASATPVAPPPAPAGLTGFAGNAQVSLSWNASTGATGYNVKRSLTTGGPYTTIAVGVSTTSYTDSGVTNGTTYYYVVTATNAGGESGNSNQVSATPQIPPPPPPGNPAATAGNAQVSLSWSASPTATSYNVKRSTTSGGPYTTIATGVTTTSYTDTGLTNGTTYYYVISAVNAGGEGGNSSQVSATPQAGPPAPANLIASRGDTQVSMAWSASSGATSYKVKRSTTSGGPYTIVAMGVTNTWFTDSGLTNGTAYFYVVTAVNTSGESGNSNQASATPSASLTVTYQINAGGSASGSYAADNFFSGGSTGTTSVTISTSGVIDPAPQQVYKDRRFVVSPGSFTYTFPSLTVGAVYTVRLHFEEHAKSGSGQRQFNVTINGVQVLTNFDIFAASGGKDKAVVEQFATTANTSGQIVIVFSSGAFDNPLVNGLQIEH